MKKLNKFSLCLAGVLSFTAVAAAVTVAPMRLTANANSGPSSWSGVAASGAIFSGENCPIEVESEVLTFEIPHLIEYNSSREELLEYSSGFSAEYTFKNPTQNAVNATLAFPLGQHSDFGYWEKNAEDHYDKFVYLEDMLAENGRYNVSVDGEQIDAEMRYTFHAWNGFDFSEESKRICDGFRQHDFYNPDLPVYKYSFDIYSDETGEFNAELTVTDKNLRFAGDYGNISEGKNSKTVTYHWIKNGEQIELYTIGGGLDENSFAWKFYKPYGIFDLFTKKIEAQAVLSPKAEVEVTTFKDYVFAGYSGGNGASEYEKSDFYNAALDYIDEYLTTSMLPKSFDFLENSSYLMRWFVYDLNFSAGQTIKNTVSAPLFSGGLYTYTPYVYTYNYLLSPAQKWSGFNSLEIRINTPYYVVNSSLYFEKTESGYVYISDGLPDGELEFELCTVENPEHKTNYGYTIFAVIVIIVWALIILVPLALVIAFIVWIAIRSKKGNSKANKNGSNGFIPMNTFSDGK